MTKIKVLALHAPPMHHKILYRALVMVAVLVVLAIIQDSLYAAFYTTSFYFSESLLFSSFWWIFIPVLYVQYIVSKTVRVKSAGFAVLLILPMILHFIIFPALVWVISALFFDHTFRFEQTLRFALPAYLNIVWLAYTVPVCVNLYVSRKIKQPDAENKVAFRETLLVSEGSRKLTLPVSEIVYISANSPYIDIHTATKKYVYSETLKSIAAQLPPGRFVRIHKSTIVNLRFAASYTSRLNGDYDLAMLDGTELRVSRNFVAGFKQHFQHGHQLAVK